MSGISIGVLMVKKKQTEPEEFGNPEFGRRLAKLRKEAGLTQFQLAELLGTTQSLVSRYEKGQRRMYDDMLAATAKALQVTPNDILGIGPCKPIKTDDSSLTRRLVLQMKQIEALPRRAQEKVMASLELALDGARSKIGA
jgi:transcriptional regulator with XRE-family HTH domain